MRVLIAILFTALLVAPAAAQKKSDDEKRAAETERKTIDRAYRSAADNIREQKVEVDPWGNVRGSGAAPAQAKPKAGATAR